MKRCKKGQGANNLIDLQNQLIRLIERHIDKFEDYDDGVDTAIMGLTIQLVDLYANKEKCPMDHFRLFSEMSSRFLETAQAKNHHFCGAIKSKIVRVEE